MNTRTALILTIFLLYTALTQGDETTINHANPKGLPTHIAEQWERETAMGYGKVGVDIEEMTRLAKLPREATRPQNYQVFWKTAPIELHIIEMSKRDKHDAAKALHDLWSEMDPNRPKSASVEEELIQSNGENWRQGRNSPTCSSHATEAIVRHSLWKRGVEMQEWNANELVGIPATMGEALRAIPERRGVDFRVRKLTVTSTILGNRQAWVPVLKELMKQELVKGHPVAFAAVMPMSRSYNEAQGWRLKAERGRDMGLHAVVLVGFKEDGETTTWRAWDSNAPNKGMRDVDDDFLSRRMLNTAYSIE